MSTTVVARALRKESSDALLQKLDELKKELSSLRVAKATGQNAQKVAKIKSVRQGIARVLTVYNQGRKASARAAAKESGKIPKDLRPKLTRALRRKLTKEQANKKTVREVKRAQNIGQRKFAVTL